jgi:hypothetical protein
MVLFSWNRPVILSTLALFAIYFPLAWWLSVSYVPPPPIPTNPPAPGAIRLFGPFNSYDNSKTAFIAAAPALDSLADSSAEQTRSPFLLYENDTPLGPAHSLHVDIIKEGRGRFSHWKGIGFVFSASDNANPNTVARGYWVVRP